MRFTCPRIALSLSLAAVIVGTGCQQTAKGLEEDAKRNSDRLEERSEKAGERIAEGAEKAKDAVSTATDQAGDRLATGAEKAAEAVSTATDQAAAGAAAAGATLEVKTALMADKRVDASRIDVDSDGVAKVVHVRGFVLTAAEIETATEIAKSKAPPGWTVSNELVAAPKLP